MLSSSLTSVRTLRELQESSQNELADISGVPQSMISAIENDRVSLCVERAKTLARTLKCHPAVLLFPVWTVASNPLPDDRQELCWQVRYL